MLHRLIPSRQGGPLVFILLIICIFLLSNLLQSPHCFKYLAFPFSNLPSTSKSVYEPMNNTEDEQTSVDDFSIWCLHMAERLDAEQHFPQSPILQVPPVNSTRLQRLPYRYSQWTSSSRLPRRITPCEHSLIMRLLMIIERLCRNHHITFMLSDGTLLGSLRHHDIIPWDDDIDMMIPVEEQTRFTDLIKQMNETLVQHRVLANAKRKREYYKIFFRNTPSAGSFSWNFPFVDVFFYVKNDTHLWQMADPDTIVDIKYIFPLVMRPLGELWLPAPRSPRQLFPFDPFDDCKGHFWDHRIEKGQRQILVKCNTLKDVYPFVDQNNQSSSEEVLRLNNTIIHTIIYN